MLWQGSSERFLGFARNDKIIWAAAFGRAWRGNRRCDDRMRIGVRGSRAPCSNQLWLRLAWSISAWSDLPSATMAWRLSSSVLGEVSGWSLLRIMKKRITAASAIPIMTERGPGFMVLIPSGTRNKIKRMGFGPMPNFCRTCDKYPSRADVECGFQPLPAATVEIFGKSLVILVKRALVGRDARGGLVSSATAFAIGVDEEPQAAALRHYQPHAASFLSPVLVFDHRDRFQLRAGVVGVCATAGRRTG
jgi:hypothetical protein